MTDLLIRTEPLGGSPLSLAVQRGELPASWCCPRPGSSAAWRARAESRRAEQDWGPRLAALEAAVNPRGEAARRFRRVVEGNGVFVTTGQQPGLYGGPLYTWIKAVTALALADAMEAATGVPAAPLFWAATDDADFAETAETFVAQSGGLVSLRALLAPPAGTPASLAPIGDLGDAFARLRDACGSAPDERALDAVRDAYGSPSRSIGDSFVHLLRALLEPLGVPVLDASHPAVAAASRPLLERALANAGAVEGALDERTAALRAKNLEPQVELVRGLSLVFARTQGLKQRLPVGATDVPANAVLTPNVLLRPVVEQAILPTVAYVAGPGELAYFAQVGAAADALGVVLPLAVPRWSATLLEPHARALLAQLGTSVEALAAPDQLEGRLARHAMSDASAQALEDVRVAIRSLPGRLADEAGPLGLTAAVEGAMQNLQHRMDRLERRVVAGIKRREAGVMRDIATLRAALRPRGKAQERTLNAIPFLARHGLDTLTELVAAARPHAESLVHEQGSAVREPT